MNICNQPQNFEIEKIISTYFEVDYDLFLIGSRVNKNFKDDSDYDYILIFSKQKKVSDLIIISEKLNSTLSNSVKTKVSVKIFDLKTFKNLYFQDYFRYIEYKISHKAIINNCKVFNLEYGTLNHLTLFNQLKNSIIIQYWWSIITISNKPETEVNILEKLKNRIKRNKQLYDTITNSKIKESEIIKSITKSTLYLLINELNTRNYTYFLTKYFDEFEHEMVNKSNYYQKTLEEMFPNVRASVNHLKKIKYELD